MLMLAALPAAPAVEVEAVTIGMSHAWTGNGYVPTPGDPGGRYDFPVTGSEAAPLDTFAGMGLRVRLTGGPRSVAVLTVAPSIQIGRRPYLVFASGRVVPTQIESAAGEEDGVPGIGSGQVTTLRLPVPLGFELRFAGRHAILIAVSPTVVVRIVPRDLPDMHAFFYDEMRFLMPEAAAGYRVSLGERLEATLYATYGVSVGDLPDETLPVYDQMRVAAGIDVGIRPRSGIR